MAIAIVEKLIVIVPLEERERTLRLLQAFQKVELLPPDEAETTPFSGASEELEQWNDTLLKITNAQKILAQWDHTGALAKLKNGRACMTLSSLEEEVGSNKWHEICKTAIERYGRLESVRNERSEINRRIDTWMPWRPLKVHPQSCGDGFKYTGILCGSVPTEDYTKFTEQYVASTDGRGYCETLFQSADQSGVLLLFPREIQQVVLDLCKESNFSTLNFPYEDLPEVMLKQWAAIEEDLLKEESLLLSELEQLAENKEVLDLAEEFYRTLILRSEAKQMTLHTKATVSISGWIEKELSAELEGLLRRELNCPYYLSFSEVESSEVSQVPIILKNKKVVGAFESLTEMYSMPAYDEVDPTPVMTPFYLVFFGMMVADIGYGLVLMLGTLGAKFLFKPDRPLMKSIDFFFYLSFPVMIWGVIYGSFFGMSLPFALFNPSEDIIPILVLSLVFGWMQLMVGLAMNVFVNVKKKDILSACSGGVSWMLLLLGLAALVLSKLVLKNNGLFVVGAIISCLAVVGIVVLPIVESKNHRVKGLLKGLYALYGATGYIGDLVSYTRLMALGVAGSSIAVAFNTILSALPLAGRVTFGLLLAPILHALNLFLSLLGAYVHGIRLQYVEFFGKFYGGGGRKFSPFKTAEKHIYLIEEGTENI